MQRSPCSVFIVNTGCSDGFFSIFFVLKALLGACLCIPDLYQVILPALHNFKFSMNIAEYSHVLDGSLMYGLEL